MKKEKKPVPADESAEEKKAREAQEYLDSLPKYIGDPKKWNPKAQNWRHYIRDEGEFADFANDRTLPNYQKGIELLAKHAGPKFLSAMRLLAIGECHNSGKYLISNFAISGSKISKEIESDLNLIPNIPMVPVPPKEESESEDSESDAA
jgi:hypothetical protein